MFISFVYVVISNELCQSLFRSKAKNVAHYTQYNRIDYWLAFRKIPAFFFILLSGKKNLQDCISDKD